MAIALVQSTGVFTGSAVTSQALSYTGSTVAGNFLVCGVNIYTTTSTTISVSDSTNGSWFPAGSYDGGGFISGRIGIFYLPKCPAASPSLTAKWDGAITGVELHIAEFSGVSSLNPFDGSATNGNDASGNLNGGTIGTSVSGDLVVGMCQVQTSCTLGTGMSQISSQDGDISAYFVQSAAGPAQVIWGGSVGSQFWAALSVAFKPPLNYNSVRGYAGRSGYSATKGYV